jgi:hypothetical protein
MSKLEDGTGQGYLQKVNGNNQAYTYSVSINEDGEATKTGRSYNINTGWITLTNDTVTPVLYLKNNEVEDLHVTAIAVGFGPSTGGGTIIEDIIAVRNPTAGTIVSGATDVDINSNRNYGSASVLTVDAYKGATGNTMTDGTDHLLIAQNDGGRAFATIDEVLPQGTSIGIKITPATGNTNMRVYAAIICHLEDANA